MLQLGLIECYVWKETRERGGGGWQGRKKNFIFNQGLWRKKLCVWWNKRKERGRSLRALSWLVWTECDKGWQNQQRPSFTNKVAQPADHCVQPLICFYTPPLTQSQENKTALSGAYFNHFTENKWRNVTTPKNIISFFYSSIFSNSLLCRTMLYSDSTE